LSYVTRIRRTATIPDEFRIARSRRAPELGPRLLFFTGGTAMRELSRAIKLYTHNTIHLITPFDSGGSSARLRDAFGMLSVGDLRNRLMALADETVRGHPEILQLFSYRFPRDGAPAELDSRLRALVDGDDALVEAVPEPMRRIIRTHLRFFSHRMPRGFDLRGASIGNLILAGGYLANDRDIDSVTFLFSKLVEVRGMVRPVAEADLHLCAELQDGSKVVGQHRLTGKEEEPIASAVRSLYLVEALDRPKPARVDAPEKVLELIRQADLVCYPIGSFYSSVVANLLPEGVGRSISEQECPKVYVPNMGHDPEQRGMSVADAVETLVEHVRRDAGEDVPVERIVNFVAIDRRQGDYTIPLELERVRALGVEVLDLPLVGPADPWIDATRLAEVLLSLA
jgi:CofD-related protein of GAK system